MKANPRLSVEWPARLGVRGQRRLRVRAVPAPRTQGEPGGDDAADFLEACGRAVFGQVVGLVPEGISKSMMSIVGMPTSIESDMVVGDFASESRT